MIRLRVVIVLLATLWLLLGCASFHAMTPEQQAYQAGYTTARLAETLFRQILRSYLQGQQAAERHAELGTPYDPSAYVSQEQMDRAEMAYEDIRAVHDHYVDALEAHLIPSDETTQLRTAFQVLMDITLHYGL